MSRSRRKTPILPITTAESDKPFKTAEHRRERRSARSVLNKHQDGDDRRLHSEVFGDPWKGLKDGKQYCPEDRKSTWK